MSAMGRQRTGPDGWKADINCLQILTSQINVRRWVVADRQQMNREQRLTGIALLTTLAAQVGLSFTQAGFSALLLPAVALGIVTAVLTLRSDHLLRTLGPKRALLAIVSLGLATLFGLSLLVDDPRSPLLMQASRIVLIDFAFLGLGRLCAALIAGNRPAHG